jgi:S-DNA-T family DNA segregation ATPase FtsK/SpoIIIE
MPTTRRKKTSTTSKPAPRKKTASQSSTKKTGASRSSSSRTPKKRSLPPISILPNGISPERKIDILGIALAVLGLLTVLSLFSANRSGLSGSWLGTLEAGFGWGMYILPIGLSVIGIWLVARNVDNLPELSVERITGFILLFVNLLVVFQGLSGSASGNGGGYFGKILLQTLMNLLGGVGAFILVVAWFLISLTMSLDISIHELFQWAAPVFERLSQGWQNRSGTAPSIGAPIKNLSSNPPESPPDDFTPLQRQPNQSQVNTPPPGVVIKTGLSSTTSVPWVLPQVKDILEVGITPAINQEYLQKRARLIEETLASFGAPSQVVEISNGPSITQFGVEPLYVETRNGRTRVRVSKIVALTDDLALALAAPRIRIQAPVPGRSYIGIEVPNEEMTMVMLRDVLESDQFKRIRSTLRFALGKGVAGHPLVSDLGSMPHLLIAGTTGSGKSVCVNSILTCLLLNNTPDDMRLVLIDPKRVELTGYNGIPHLLSPVVVEMDRVVGALQWMTREMDSRYHKFAEVGARNIVDYNARLASQGNGPKMGYIVVVIDELADLMMIAPDESERTITRLAQLARATGIHLVIATQRPSVDVVTGLIKANFPARIAFAVASGVDSRVILDHPGAERLLGRGDMLFQAPDAASPVRVQGVFVSDTEIQRLTHYWRDQAGAISPMVAATPGAAVDAPAYNGVPLKQVAMFEDMSPEEKGDPLLNDAIELVRREARASVSMLQRRLRIGYTRAARLVDSMEDSGIISPSQPGSQVREVLDYGQTIPPLEDGM